MVLVGCTYSLTTVLKAATQRNRNRMTSKAALDFAFNFGSQKQWQFYVEPSIAYGLNDKSGTPYNMGNSGIQYNINHSYVQLNGGLIYKFANSNGTHNFKNCYSS